MSDAIRWELSASHPLSKGSVTLATLARVYKDRVEQALTTGTGQQYRVTVNWSTCLLNDGEDWSWRESNEAMRYLSQECPELIWCVHARGEEHTEWVIYAYRGVEYQEQRPEWVFPPPNMDRLPTPQRLELPSDPLDAEAALRMALEQMKHVPTCPALDVRPFKLVSYCTCPYGEVLKSLSALEKKRLNERLANHG